MNLRRVPLVLLVALCAAACGPSAGEQIAGRIRDAQSSQIVNVTYMPANQLDPEEVQVTLRSGTTPLQANEVWCQVVVPARGDSKVIVSLWNEAGNWQPSSTDCGGAPSQTAAVGASPLAPVMVESRLRTLDPNLTLATWTDDRDMGEYPRLVYRATTTSNTGIGRSLRAILVYPTAAARKAVQDDFREMSIQGPNGVINWDGTMHSEWVGAENVIVEIVMPGGTFGGRTPTPSENAYPELVRLALLS
jgi:hypothetical protein